MTDKKTLSDDAVLYKKAYERERMSRRETESILEEKTMQLYIANIELTSTNELLMRQQKNMVKTEKMAALGQLSAGVAHEINNPLAFVISNINSLKKHVGLYFELVSLCKSLDKDFVGYDWFKDQDFDYINNDSNLIFEEVNEGLIRVKDIVANLKSFSRTQSGDRELVSIDSIIDSALKIAHNHIKYHCNVELGLSECEPIYCNANELIQVFLNLIVNAGQAIKGNGTIGIYTRSTEDYLIVDVKDSGCGIPEEHIGKIFDPFFTAKPLGEGTGLGLSVSYGILKDLDGTISVESVVGEGTTFTVLIPIDQRQSDR